MMTHGKSELVSWGATSLNPDVSDLYVEYIKNGHYMASNRDTWEKIEERTRQKQQETQSRKGTKT